MEDKPLESQFADLTGRSFSYILSSLVLQAENDIQNEVLKRWLAHKRFEPELRIKIEDSVNKILEEYKSELKLVASGKSAGRYLGTRLIVGFMKEYQNG